MEKHKASSMMIGTTETIIEKYTFPRQYQNTGDRYEFVLVEVGGKIFLKDQGRTVKMLDSVFELKEKDVIKNLVTVLKEFKIVHKEGKELFVEISPWDGNANEKDNSVLNEAIFALFACISFMDNMRIFYN